MMPKPAAEPWNRGTPDSAGRYLCLYQTPGKGVRAFVFDYVEGEDGDLEWQKESLDVEVLCWAEINVE